MPDVSVIIPTYNRSLHVRSAIDSVLNQSFLDFEVIVVDDGSTDDTPAVLYSYGNEIRVLRQNNGGVSSARNRGLLAASGKWVAFLDSDDVWHKDKLQIQMSDLSSAPNAVVHMSNAKFIDANGNAIEYFKLRNYQQSADCQVVDQPFWVILKHSLASLPTCICRRSALAASGLFCLDYSIYEDLDFLLRVSLVGTMVINRRVLASFIRRDEPAQISLTNRGNIELLRRYQTMVRLLEKFIDLPSLDDKERLLVRHIASSYCFLQALQYKKHNDKKMLRSLLMRSLMLHGTLKTGLKCIFGMLPRWFVNAVIPDRDLRS